MAEIEYDMLFGLLRNALWSGEPDIALYERADEELWNKVIDIAVKHAVSGHIADAVMSLPVQYRPSQDVISRLVKYVDAIENNAKQLRAATEEAALKYREANLDFFLIKGISLGLTYPIPCHRIQRDVDFFFPDGDSAEADNLLSGQNKTSVGEPDKSVNRLIENQSLLGSLHSPYLICADMDVQLRLLLAEREPIMIHVGREMVKTPSPEFNVLYLLGSAATTIDCKRLKLRNMCDLVMQLRFYGETIDKEFLNDFIGKYGLKSAANSLGLLCVDNLGIQEEVFPLKLLRDDKSLSDYMDSMACMFL